MMATGEEGMPFINLEYTARLYRSNWQDISLGTNQAAFLRPRWPFFLFVNYLQRLGLNLHTIQRIFLSLLIFLSLISMFWFSTQLLPDTKNKYWISFAVSIYYLFNPFVSINIWNRFLYTLMFSLPLLPATLAIFWQGLKSQKIYWTFLLPIPSLIFSIAFGSPAVAILLWVSLTTLWAGFLILDKGKLLWKIRYFLTSLIIWIIINIWWIIPQLTLATPQSSLTTSTYNLSSFHSTSRYFSAPYVVRLLSSDFLFENQTWGPVYSTWYFQIISWLIPIFVLVTAIKYRRNHLVVIFVGLAVVGLFIAKGSSPPAGEVMVWLLKYIRPLQLLRNPFEKMGLMVVIAYSGLLAIGIDHVITWTKKKHQLYLGIAVTSLLLFLVSGVYLWPVWIGQLFGSRTEKIDINVPSYYLSARVWLAKNLGNYRILSLPAAFGDGGVYKFGPNFYHGLDPLNQIFGVPVVSQTLAVEPSDAMYRNYLKWWPTLPLWKSAGLFSAKLIMTNPDIAWKKLGLLSPDKISQSLKFYNAPGLNLSKINPCIENSLFPRCTLVSSQQNWQNINFLKIIAQGKKSQKLEVNVVDDQGHILRFDGQSDPDYIFSEPTTEFILPLYQPTEGNPDFSFTKVSRVNFYSRPEVKITSLELDPGTLQAQPFLLSPISFGPLSFYEVSSQVRVDRIFVANQMVWIENSTSIFRLLGQSDILPGKAVFVSPYQAGTDILRNILREGPLPQIKFVQVSSSHYRIEIIGASTPFLLGFHETYDPHWQIYLSGKTFPHFMIDGYANGYLINQTGNFYLDLIYD